MTSKQKHEIAVINNSQINENLLFTRVAEIIENRKYRAAMYANQESVLMFWEIGKYIGSVLLGGERAGYGKQIVVPLAQQLGWSQFSSVSYQSLIHSYPSGRSFTDASISIVVRRLMPTIAAIRNPPLRIRLSR